MIHSDSHALRHENPELVAVLAANISNTTPQSEASLATAERLIDGMLVDICRAQNMHKIPLLTVAASLLCEANKTSREYHDTDHGLLFSSCKTQECPNPSRTQNSLQKSTLITERVIKTSRESCVLASQKHWEALP